MDLSDIRQRLSAVDEELIRLIAERQRIVDEVSRWKLETGRATPATWPGGSKS